MTEEKLQHACQNAAVASRRLGMVLLPRKVLGKTPKWQSFYAGSFLTVRLLSTTNAVIQKLQRSKQQIVHVDKHKLYIGETPKSWLQLDNDADYDRSGADDDETTEVEEVCDSDGSQDVA